MADPPFRPFLRPAAFAELLELLRDAFSFREGAELAVEIDPRTLTAEMAAALSAGGVNRASLGVQSFDPQVQRAVNRLQSFEQTRRSAWSGCALWASPASMST